MRVGHVGPYPTPYRLALWAEVARRCDHTVWSYSLGTRRFPWSIEIPPGVDLRIARTASVHLRGMDTPLHVLQGWRPDDDLDVVVVNEWVHPASWQLLRWAGRRHLPVMLEFESTVRDHAHRRGPVDALRRWCVRQAAAYLVPGEGAAAAVRRAGASDDRIVIGDMVPDVARFSAAGADGAGDAPGHRFLFVGRLVALKNVDLAIRAFAEVRRAGDELWIVGDGPERPRLAAQAAPLGAVSFLGHRQPAEVVDVLGRCHTVLLPSRREVWGMTVAEALVAGRHVVVSDRAGIVPTVVDHPGVFVTAPDAAPLARAMAASRDAWTGPIADPPMRRRTPALAADRYVEACERAHTSSAKP